MNKIYLLLVCSLTPFLLYGQGVIDGFMKGKGNTDLALSFSWQKAESYFAGTEKIPFTNTKLIAGLFAEHGFSERLDLVLNLPLVNGIVQDGSIHLKYLALSSRVGKTMFSFIPTAGFSAPLSRYETEIASAIGQRATVLQPAGLIQATFSDRFFINVRGGYNYSFIPVPGSYFYSFKIGFYKNRFYSDVWFDNQETSGGKDYRGQGELAGKSFREYGVSYSKIGGTIYYQCTGKAGIAAGADHTLSGRNFFNSNRVSLSLVYKFHKH